MRVRDSTPVAVIGSQQNQQEKTTPGVRVRVRRGAAPPVRQQGGVRGATLACLAKARRAGSLAVRQPCTKLVVKSAVQARGVERAVPATTRREVRRRGGPMGSSAGSTPRARPPRQPRGAGEGAGEAPSTPVFLNVYDVTPANGYARWLGLGVYHSGVQVHGVEYAYGAHDGAGSGIFEVVPRRCPGYTFRESVQVGATSLSRAEVRAVMADLAADFPGDAYNLVSRNCNHFCDAACRRLVRARIPRWVNRLAKIGVVFTCVIPGNGRALRRDDAGCDAAAGPPGGKAAGIRSRSARHGASAAPPPRPRTFFRSLSVGRRNLPTPRPLPAEASSPPPPAPASTSTPSGPTT
ncbi:hypothetical protein BS78_10G064800 [Paspalum vaginatum]|nr:hypothetical protein BS78_10G064800 [Paspalum vaginatum]